MMAESKRMAMSKTIIGRAIEFLTKKGESYARRRFYDDSFFVADGVRVFHRNADLKRAAARLNEMGVRFAVRRVSIEC